MDSEFKKDLKKLIIFLCKFFFIQGYIRDIEKEINLWLNRIFNGEIISFMQINEPMSSYN